METGDLIQLCTNLGFMAMVCIAQFRQNEKLESRHDEESKGFISAIAANTSAIEKLHLLLEKNKEES